MSHSIFQQVNASLNATSSAQLIPDITHPLSKEASSFEYASRFAYLLYTNRPGLSAANGIIDGKDSIDYAVKALHDLLLAYADENSLAEAVTSLLRTRITRILQLETEVEAAK